MLVLLVSPPWTHSKMGTDGPHFLKEAISVGCVPCALQAHLWKATVRKRRRRIHSPRAVYAFSSFVRLRKLGVSHPQHLQLHHSCMLSILSIHNSWKSLFSLSIAGPCALQLNYPRDLRVPDCCSDSGPEQLHRYWLFQESHMSIFIWAWKIAQHQFVNNVHV